jgi:hypothetical protein
MVITKPDDISTFRLLALRSGLKLEIRGMRRSGRSCYAIIKKEFGLKGTKQEVLEQFDEMLAPIDALIKQ